MRDYHQPHVRFPGFPGHQHRPRKMPARRPASGLLAIHRSLNTIDRKDTIYVTVEKGSAHKIHWFREKELRYIIKICTIDEIDDRPDILRAYHAYFMVWYICTYIPHITTDNHRSSPHMPSPLFAFVHHHGDTTYDIRFSRSGSGKKIEEDVPFNTATAA